MTKFALDAKADQTVDFEYRGLNIKLRQVPDIRGWHKKGAELAVKYGLDHSDKSDESHQRSVMVGGAAMVGTMVVDIETFEFDGETFNFNNPSEMDMYENQGEELLGGNEVMQNDLYKHCLALAKTPPDYEVQALGKSLPQSDSGDKMTALASV